MVKSLRSISIFLINRNKKFSLVTLVKVTVNVVGIGIRLESYLDK